MSLVKNINRFLRNSIDEGIEALSTTNLMIDGKRLLNRDFKNAFAAAVALVATSDGHYDEDEKERIIAYIKKY